jgi:hypothetical protein
MAGLFLIGVVMASSMTATALIAWCVGYGSFNQVLGWFDAALLSFCFAVEAAYAAARRR